MPKATTTDISLTKSYIPKVSKILGISPTIAQFYKPIENHNIHKDRNIKSQMVSLNLNQILTKELSPDIKQWEVLIRENMFGLGGHRDRLLACLAHMLYCVISEEQYNLAYFFVERIECARATPTANLPYGIFLTRLYRYVMEAYPYLDNGIYDIVERVMRPLALRQTRQPRSDRGKARHSIYSSSSHHQGTSSHQHDDDDVKTSRGSTPSPTTYLNSLNPLDYQNYQIPSSFEQIDETHFARQTTLINQTQRMHVEICRGFKSFGKALKRVFRKKKK
nr:ribosomal protein L7Ae/L30e/S12e/Gadd45 [Tanacetum cinerariifolium]GEZ79720.1 ribosomal protein L7Ae/L30e/S12e/Gadd45 [Tanacetum cinerariifolium]